MNVVVAALNYYECNTAIIALQVAIDARNDEIDRVKKSLDATPAQRARHAELIESRERDVRYFSALLKELNKAAAVLRVLQERA